MVRIKVQYDARKRVFKLVDEQFQILLEGDGLYDLELPINLDELSEGEGYPTFDAHMAHA